MSPADPTDRSRAWLLAGGVVALLVLLVLLGLVAKLVPARPLEGDTVASGDGWTTRSLDIMGTTLEVVLPEAQGEQADVAFAVFREVDALMSEWREGSPISAINRGAGGEPVQVPAAVLTLIQRGVELGALTDGAFDITWAGLRDLWDFKAADPRPPEVAVAAARAAAVVDYRKIEIDAFARTVRLPVAGMAIGLGGIAKGWALQQAADALREVGVADFMMSAGGQVLAGGRRGDRPWRVGIRDPRGEADDAFASVDVSDASVATSGDYESFFEIDGARYHHVLNPRDGMPALELRSATVIAPDPVLADALSTALMVMGRDQALALVARLADVECVMVNHRGKLDASPALQGRLVVRRPPRPR